MPVVGFQENRYFSTGLLMTYTLDIGNGFFPFFNSVAVHFTADFSLTKELGAPKNVRKLVLPFTIAYILP